MKTVIEMAREAEFQTDSAGVWVDYVYITDQLARFAELVCADERDRAMRENAYVLAEREACAKFFDDNDTNMFWGSQAAQHIRSRSNT